MGPRNTSCCSAEGTELPIGAELCQIEMLHVLDILSSGKKIEHHCRSDKNPDSYSRGFWIESRPGDWIQKPQVFVGFLSQDHREKLAVTIRQLRVDSQSRVGSRRSESAVTCLETRVALLEAAIKQGLLKT
jgi:hypothetical protein